MDSNKALDQLKKWKDFPAYKAEPRVDWLIVLSIPELLKKRYESKCKLILPEFPIRKGTITSKILKKPNQSYRIDFYALLENGLNVLIEIKTDMKSIDEKQIKHMLNARDVGMKEVLKGLSKIYNAASSEDKLKYNNLLEELISESVLDKKLDLVGNVNDNIEIVYIQPNKNEEDYLYEVFDFEDVHNVLSKSNDNFIRGFSEILLGWRQI